MNRKKILLTALFTVATVFCVSAQKFSPPPTLYTMIVDVLDCDFGAYVGPLSVPAKLKCAITINLSKH
jgi:hypothetical protein